MSIILIVGSTGAGKTTYANKLANALPASVYSIDNWMKALYWQDMPLNPDGSWFKENSQWYMDRINRCEDLIIQDATARAKINHSSILDMGFSTADHRVKFIKAFQKHGIDVHAHYLDVAKDIRWQRVQQRNLTKDNSFVMNVDREMFDYIESIFQPPSPQEGAKIIRVG